MGGLRVLVIKCLGHEADHSTPSTVEVKDEELYLCYSIYSHSVHNNNNCCYGAAC
jgi:hypothetical protein